MRFWKQYYSDSEVGKWVRWALNGQRMGGGHSRVGLRGWQVLMWCENKNSAQKWCISYEVLEG